MNELNQSMLLALIYTLEKNFKWRGGTSLINSDQEAVMHWWRLTAWLWEQFILRKHFFFKNTFYFIRLPVLSGKIKIFSSFIIPILWICQKIFEGLQKKSIWFGSYNYIGKLTRNLAVTDLNAEIFYYLSCYFSV